MHVGNEHHSRLHSSIPVASIPPFILFFTVLVLSGNLPLHFPIGKQKKELSYSTLLGLSVRRERMLCRAVKVVRFHGLAYMVRYAIGQRITLCGYLKEGKP